MEIRTEIKIILIVILLILGFILATCTVPKYSKEYYTITKVVNDTTYKAKIEVGDWVHSIDIEQSYEVWEKGDTVFLTKHKPNKK
jgi:hypothetical protein